MGQVATIQVLFFAMTVINNQLVLVGGWELGHARKMLGVWRAEGTEWTHPYMPTARSSSSAVVHHEWLVVAGGWREERRLSSVEVMNTDTNPMVCWTSNSNTMDGYEDGYRWGHMLFHGWSLCHYQ